MSPIELGSPAPPFELPTDGGGSIRLSDLRGSKLVLYFYPTDDTETCTAEALDFSAHAAEFMAAGATILGVSNDSVRSHDKFRQKYGLGFRLGSDEAGTVLRSYGVWQEKKTFGRTHMGIVRTTFLIDTAGTIVRTWPRVRVKGHAELVLAAVKSL